MMNAEGPDNEDAVKGVDRKGLILLFLKEMEQASLIFLSGDS
jgi:hypothetical protein